MDSKLRIELNLWKIFKTDPDKIVEATGDIHSVYSLRKY